MRIEKWEIGFERGWKIERKETLFSYLCYTYSYKTVLECVYASIF